MAGGRDCVVVFCDQSCGAIERGEVRQTIDEVISVDGVDAVGISLALEVAHGIVAVFGTTTHVRVIHITM